MFGKRRSSRKDPGPLGRNEALRGESPRDRESERDLQRAAEALADGAIPLKMPPMKSFRRDVPTAVPRPGGVAEAKGPATLSAGPGSLPARPPQGARPVVAQPNPAQPRPGQPNPTLTRPALPARPARPPLPGAMPAAAARTPAERLRDELTAAHPGRNLIVGRDIRLTGEIRDCDRLVVEGVVEGDITETRMIEIAESGRVEGRVAVESCELAGTFSGELSVRDLLNLRSSARVRGRVRYGEIEIERGAELGGDVDRHEPRGPSAGRPSAAPAKDRA